MISISSPSIEMVGFGHAKKAMLAKVKEHSKCFV